MKYFLPDFVPWPISYQETVEKNWMQPACILTITRARKMSRGYSYARMWRKQDEKSTLRESDRDNFLHGTLVTQTKMCGFDQPFGFSVAMMKKYIKSGIQFSNTE